ncbi:Uncharacterised protein [Streptococcus pneumoniae]|nr:Uncharacterised protein [Streptococcus pneumoniae]
MFRQFFKSSVFVEFLDTFVYKCFQLILTFSKKWVNVRLLVAWKIDDFQVVQTLVLDDCFNSDFIKNLVVKLTIAQVAHDLL